MAAPPPPQPPAASNWYSEWATRTPAVCRCAILTVLPATLLGWLGGSALSLIPNAVLLRGEVWRVFTAIPVQDGALTLLVVCLMLAIQAPPFEVKRGSVPFLLANCSNFWDGQAVLPLARAIAIAVAAPHNQPRSACGRHRACLDHWERL
jgi:hypothetical protein